MRARRRELAALVREIRALGGQVGRGLYEIGRRLGRVREQALWDDGSYTSFADFVERALDMAPQTAYRFVAVARHFNAQVAERYGVTKLDAAIRYLHATAADERPGDVLAAEIRIRGPHGRFRTLPLHQASARQIDEATALLREAREGSARIPASLRRRVSRLVEALPAAPVGTGRGQRVRLQRGRDGRLAVSFRAIPLDELPAFSEAIAEHLS